jgi:hypothetical protein
MVIDMEAIPGSSKFAKFCPCAPSSKRYLLLVPFVGILVARCRTKPIVERALTLDHVRVSCWKAKLGHWGLS